MPFLLEGLRFIESKVLEDCITKKRYDQEYIDKTVDHWVNIIGISITKEWERLLIKQTKQHIFHTLQERLCNYAIV